MKTAFTLGFALLIALSSGCSVEQPPPTDSEWLQKATDLARSVIIIDTHVDIPYRLEAEMEDISQRTAGGDFDYPRAREGGLDIPFMSIYVPSSFQEIGGARQVADSLIDMVEGFERDWPDKFKVVRSVEEVHEIFGSGRIGLPMGMENGAPIEGDLENLKHFYDRGIRYITLTHATANHISDSSYDPTRKWNGLSPFGKTAIAEMNRLGIIVDISHVSDEAFFQAAEISQAPMIASHSSCRHFTPGFERNMSDDMIRKLAEKGGVIQVNFGSSFLSASYLASSQERSSAIEEYVKANELTEEDPQARQWIEDYDAANPIERADVSDVADHIDHIQDLVGIDHVGLGSDFDGVGDSLPTGLKDVSQYPNLFAVLLERGYSPEDIEKIASGNLLRVWSEVERIAADGPLAE